MAAERRLHGDVVDVLPRVEGRGRVGVHEIEAELTRPVSSRVRDLAGAGLIRRGDRLLQRPRIGDGLARLDGEPGEGEGVAGRDAGHRDVERRRVALGERDRGFEHGAPLVSSYRT